MKRLLWFVTFLVFCVAGRARAIGNFTNSGRVLDKDGRAVAMAMVTYLSMDRRLDYTYTDANGYFTASSTAHAGRPGAVPQGAAAPGGVVDTLRIGKTGYEPVLVPIKSYTEQIGTVRLALIDVEAKVNAVMAKHAGDEGWMRGQITGALLETPDADVVSGKLGSVLAEMDQAFPTTNAWADAMDARQKAAMTAGNVPLLAGGLVVHGWAYRLVQENGEKAPGESKILAGLDPVRRKGGNGVIFPHNSGLGCMNDPDLVQQAYRVMALEARGVGINWTLAPFVEPLRNLKSGRCFESFSEDPAVAMQLSKAAILGLQGSDLSSPYTIAASAKYFLGSGGCVNGKTWGDAAIAPEPVMKSLFLPPYQSAIDAGVAAILVDRHSWMGKPMLESPDLLTSLLKKEMKFDGMVVADWTDGSNPEPNPSPDADAKKYPPFPNAWTASYMGTAAGFVGNGVDMSIAGDSYKEFVAGIQSALAGGKITKDRLADAVRRVLRVKARMGLLDNRKVLAERDLTDLIYSPLHREIARQCVRESLVLLKNSDHLLPLKPNQRIMVVGKAAGIEGLLCGGFTRVGRQGDDGVFIDRIATNISKAIKTRIDPKTGGKVYDLETFDGGDRSEWSHIEKFENDVDVIVAVLYECSYADWNGDDGNRAGREVGYYAGSGSSIEFTKSRMMKALIQYHGKVPMVLLLVSGRPEVIDPEYLANCKSVVACWLPGSECQGVADVLFGDYDFRGKLNHTWPAAVSQVPINAGNLGDVKGSGGDPLFPPGYGLSYK